MAIRKTPPNARSTAENAQAKRIEALETEVFELKTRLEAAQARANRGAADRSKGAARENARLDELLRQKDSTIMGLAAQIAALAQDASDRSIDDAGADAYEAANDRRRDRPRCADGPRGDPRPHGR